MLLEFRVENHRSIREEQPLSLEGSITSGELVAETADRPGPGNSVLPLAVIYGANASGKSNVLSALTFMRNAVLESQRLWEPQGRIPRQPFAWAGMAASNSLFEVTVLLNGTRIQYGFTASDAKIEEEWLFAWPKGRKQVWFERENTSAFKFGEHLKGPNEAVRELTRENSLFLSAAAQQGHRQLSQVYAWFDRIRTVPLPGDARSPRSGRLEFLFSQPSGFPLLDLNDSVRDSIRRLLTMADVGVVDLKITDDGSRGSRVFLQHQEGDEDSWLELKDESDGTQSLLWLAPVLLDVLHQGGMLLIDELDRSLHPSVSAAILELFLRAETNPKKAQLIATTHDTAVLGNIFGKGPLDREHVWFTEKDKTGSTALYPLTDYRPRVSENLQRGYLQGRYGAIPFLGDLSWVTKEE
jgi:predicted ATPase